MATLLKELLETAGMYHQFRFSVGSPQAEAKFEAAKQSAMLSDNNAKQYPVLYVRLYQITVVPETNLCC